MMLDDTTTAAAALEEADGGADAAAGRPATPVVQQGFAAGPRGGFRTGRPVPPGTARRDARFYDAVSRPTIHKVLRELEVVPFLANGCCGVGADDTCSDVWRAYDDRRVPVDDRAGFDVRRRVRAILGVLGEDEPDWVLRRYFEVFGKAAVTTRRVVPVLGQATSRETLRRLKVMAGIPVPPEDPEEARGWGKRGGFRGARPVPPGIARHDARFYDAVSGPSFRTLREWGVVDFDNGVTTVGPDASCLDVWLAYDDREPPIDDLGDFELRRRTRVVLKLSRYPQSNRALRRYLELFGAGAITRARIASVFGRHCAVEPCVSARGPAREVHGGSAAGEGAARPGT
jgi:hypothetical protein